MKNKYNMTLEQNIFVAKRNIVDYIWKSANLEGINVTFPQTYTIYEGAVVNGVSADDIVTIMNLKNTWKFLFANINKELNIEFLFRLNDYVARSESLEWGKLRYGKVGIAGTDYVPSIPVKENVERELTDILKIDNPTSRALTLMLWGMRSQLFWDGNKRTSTFAANKIMIQNGCGVISINQDNTQEFNRLLTAYYESNDMNTIKEFLYEKCIDGIDF